MVYVIDYDAPVPAWVLSAKLEAAFEARWWTDLAAAGVVWTDLTGRASQIGSTVSWGRGRPLSSGDMARTPQPSTLTVRLDSADGALTPENEASPFYPNVQPGFPVRWSVWDGSEWSGQWVGFVTNLDPSPAADGIPDWTQIDLTATDGWARVVQAGTRLAYRDRILTDLASPGSVTRLLPDNSEVRESTGIHVFAVPPNPDDAWGVGVWRLDAGGTIDWSAPGAAGVLAEVGGGYASGSTGATTTSLASDRYGGKVIALGGGLLSTSAAAENNALQQVSVARGPVQLLPASTFDPTTTSGWSTTNGVTLLPSGTPSFVASRYSYDPVTGARTAIPDGPTHSMGVQAQGTTTMVSLPVAGGVVAGRSYGAQIRCSTLIAALSLDFLNASGTVLSTAGVTNVASFATVPLTVAPAGAVSAQLRVTLNSSAATIVLYAPGIYEGASPARWWRGDVTGLQLFAQWPTIAADGTVAEWLHFRCPADVFADGQPHLVAWNKDPGVGGVPTVWIDGAAVSGTWEVSTKPSAAAPPTRSQIAAGTGSSAAVTGAGDHGAVTSDPSKVTTFLAVTGVTSPYVGQRPSQALVARWATQYGSPALWPQPATLSGTTDVLMGSLLDSLGWPRSMRDLAPGVQTTTLSWARLAYGTDGSDPTPPGDYSSDITTLAEAEFGWADVDGRGWLRWLPRRWYDPAGTGLATAVMHLSYTDALDPRATLYTSALSQQMGDADVINQVYATNEKVFSGSSVVLEDYDSQAHIGVRREEFVNPAWSDPLSVATEILALYGTARLVPASVTVQCFGPDDPKLPAMLALQPADVVAVTVPRAPAADMMLGALVTQIAASTDGLATTFALTLSPCPVTVVLDERVFLGIDTDGLPYIDPAKSPGTEHLALGDDGYYYLTTTGTLDAAQADDGTVYVSGGTS